MKRKLLVIDTETGGLNPSAFSILSLGAVVYNEGGIDGEFHVLVREPTILIDETPGESGRTATDVNGLSRDYIEEHGVGPRQAVDALIAFLMKHDMREGVTLAGHNVDFDLAFFRRLLCLAGVPFSPMFSRRALCTMTGALMLDQAGRIDLHGSGASLAGLAKYWGIPLNHHDALGDARTAALILKRELQMIGH